MLLGLLGLLWLAAPLCDVSCWATHMAAARHTVDRNRNVLLIIQASEGRNSFFTLEGSRGVAHPVMSLSSEGASCTGEAGNSQT
jgi:hypothetical protein